MQSPTYEVIAEERFDAVFPGTSERVPVRVWVAKPWTTDAELGACPCGLDKRCSGPASENCSRALH